MTKFWPWGKTFLKFFQMLGLKWKWASELKLVDIRDQVAGVLLMRFFRKRLYLNEILQIQHRVNISLIKCNPYPLSIIVYSNQINRVALKIQNLS